MQIDLTELRKRDNYINCNKHPTLDLLIWNYTPSCQFDRAWDEYTRMARGLITDLEGNVVARPFPKFFNVDEIEGTRIDLLPAELPEVREKMDGSLGILFVADKPFIATRGSFISDQSVWATEWVQKRYLAQDFREDYTYLFEIIYPDNRIVLDYGNRAELVLLAVINIEDGSELDVDDEGLRLEIETPAIINKDIWVLAKEVETLPITHEGYVLRYPDGLRVKMKGHEYIRMHKAVMQCSTTAVWDWLAHGGSVEGFSDYLPEELKEWVVDQAAWIRRNRKVLVEQSEIVYNHVVNLPTRKLQAEYLMANYPDIAWIVFVKLDGKFNDEKTQRKIWEMVKPEYQKAIFNSKGES